GGGTDTIPIPLSARIWSDAVFRQPVAVSDLFSAVMADRRAALLCFGLSALDDETLQFLKDHPGLLTRLYERDAAVFAAFAGSLRIRRGEVELPGGAAAMALWEAVVGEKVTDPDRFIRELFSRDEGRIAYVYDALNMFD